MPFRENIFSITVGVEEDDGVYWTAFPEHQNITFLEIISVCQKFKYWKAYIFIEVTDSYQEIGISM